MVPAAWLRRRNGTMRTPQAILQRAGANFAQVIKQVRLYCGHGGTCGQRAGRPRGIFGAAPASLHGLGCAASPNPAMLIEIELVVDLPDSPAGQPSVPRSTNVETTVWTLRRVLS